MNDEERSLDLQLGDALAEIESLKAENRNLACDIVEIATLRDKLLTEQGVVLRELTEAMLVVTAERDALKAGVAARRRDVYTPTPTPLSHWLDRKEGDKT